MHADIDRTITKKNKNETINNNHKQKYTTSHHNNINITKNKRQTHQNQVKSREI